MTVHAHMRIVAIMPRKPLNLNIDQELIARIKIQAIKESRDVSDIVEELFKGYLARSKGRAKLKKGGKS